MSSLSLLIFANDRGTCELFDANKKADADMQCVQSRNKAADNIDDEASRPKYISPTAAFQKGCLERIE